MLHPSRLSLIIALLLCGLLLHSFFSAPEAAVAAGYQGPALSFEHVSLFDGQSIVADRRVLVENGRIASIGPAESELAPRSDLQRIDGRGLTLMPGLIDLAVFASLDGAMPELRRRSSLPRAMHQLLLAGVTLAWDLDSTRANALALHEAQESLDMPELGLAGAAISSAYGWQPSRAGDSASPAIEVTSVDELDAALDQNESDSASLIFASLEHLARDDAGLDAPLLVELRKRAKAGRLPLLLHAQSPRKALAGLAARPRICFGPWPAEAVSVSGLAALKDSGAAVAPALASLMNSAPGKDPIELLRKLASPLLLPAGLRDAISDDAGQKPLVKEYLSGRYSTKLALENARSIHAAGIPIVLGSGAGLPGLPLRYAALAELARLREAGLSPVEVLNAATREPAKLLGRKDLGVVRQGAEAQLILVEGDPLADLSALSRVRYIVRAGKLWKADELD